MHHFLQTVFAFGNTIWDSHHNMEMENTYNAALQPAWSFTEWKKCTGCNGSVWLLLWCLSAFKKCQMQKWALCNFNWAVNYNILSTHSLVTLLCVLGREVDILRLQLRSEIEQLYQEKCRGLEQVCISLPDHPTDVKKGIVMSRLILFPAAANRSYFVAGFLDHIRV